MVHLAPSSFLGEGARDDVLSVNSTKEGLECSDGYTESHQSISLCSCYK